MLCYKENYFEYSTTVSRTERPGLLSAPPDVWLLGPNYVQLIDIVRQIKTSGKLLCRQIKTSGKLLCKDIIDFIPEFYSSITKDKNQRQLSSSSCQLSLGLISRAIKVYVEEYLQMD